MNTIFMLLTTIGVFADTGIKAFILQKGGDIYPPFFYLLKKVGWPGILIIEIAILIVIALYDNLFVLFLTTFGVSWMCFKDLEDLKETRTNSDAA